MENGVKQHLNIALSTDIFKPHEIDVLREVLYDFKRAPEVDYYMFEEKVNGTVVGFIIFGKVPLTTLAWEIYWLVVDKKFQGKGYGRRLIQRVEEFLLHRDSPVVLRVETSTRKEYAHARNLYTNQRFNEAGRIPDFYEPGDDLVVFYKKLYSEN